MSDRRPVEIANLAKVEDAISICLERNQALGESLVLGLHQLLMEGVPEKHKRPIKPGRYRDATDKVEAQNVEYLTRYMSPPWAIREDIIGLLDAAELQELPGSQLDQVGRFHYRFVRIHPFCDGNGRMARALSHLLLARWKPAVLTFAKPVNEVIADHRDDYVSVLELCDGIYETLLRREAERGEEYSEEHRLRFCETPFVIFYARAVLRAFYEETLFWEDKITEAGGTIERRTETHDSSEMDLSADAVLEYARRLWGLGKTEEKTNGG